MTQRTFSHARAAAAAAAFSLGLCPSAGAQELPDQADALVMCSTYSPATLHIDTRLAALGLDVCSGITATDYHWKEVFGALRFAKRDPEDIAWFKNRLDLPVMVLNYSDPTVDGMSAIKYFDTLPGPQVPSPNPMFVYGGGIRYYSESPSLNAMYRTRIIGKDRNNTDIVWIYDGTSRFKLKRMPGCGPAILLPLQLRTPTENWVFTWDEAACRLDRREDTIAAARKTLTSTEIFHYQGANLTSVSFGPASEAADRTLVTTFSATQNADKSQTVVERVQTPCALDEQGSTCTVRRTYRKAFGIGFLAKEETQTQPPSGTGTALSNWIAFSRDQKGVIVGLDFKNGDKARLRYFKTFLTMQATWNQSTELISWMSASTSAANTLSQAGPLFRRVVKRGDSYFESYHGRPDYGGYNGFNFEDTSFVAPVGSLAPEFEGQITSYTARGEVLSSRRVVSKCCNGTTNSPAPVTEYSMVLANQSFELAGRRCDSADSVTEASTWKTVRANPSGNSDDPPVDFYVPADYQATISPNHCENGISGPKEVYAYDLDPFGAIYRKTVTKGSTVVFTATPTTDGSGSVAYADPSTQWTGSVKFVDGDLTSVASTFLGVSSASQYKADFGAETWARDRSVKGRTVEQIRTVKRATNQKLFPAYGATTTAMESDTSAPALANSLVSSTTSTDAQTNAAVVATSTPTIVDGSELAGGTESRKVYRDGVGTTPDATFDASTVVTPKTRALPPLFSCLAVKPTCRNLKVQFWYGTPNLGGNRTFDGCGGIIQC